MSDLKPCPFCGKEPMQYIQTGLVACMYSMCGVNPECHSVDDWNMRADGWINVDERLPKAGQVVDVWLRKKRFAGQRLTNMRWMISLEHFRSEITKQNYSLDQVAHWMPLPSPPQSK